MDFLWRTSDSVGVGLEAGLISSSLVGEGGAPFCSPPEAAVAGTVSTGVPGFLADSFEGCESTELPSPAKVYY